MKYFISTIFGLFFCLVPGYASCDDFSWHMFLPVFTRGCVEQQGTCNCIAGCYEGAFADNCPGSIITGSMNFVVNADCSFNSFSNYGVQSTGSFADNNGLKYTGSGITDSNGCGEFSFACTNTGASLACNYTYKNGKKAPCLKFPLSPVLLDQLFHREVLLGLTLTTTIPADHLHAHITGTRRTHPVRPLSMDRQGGDSQRYLS